MLSLALNGINLFLTIISSINFIIVYNMLSLALNCNSLSLTLISRINFFICILTKPTRMTISVDYSHHTQIQYFYYSNKYNLVLYYSLLYNTLITHGIYPTYINVTLHLWALVITNNMLNKILSKNITSIILLTSHSALFTYFYIHIYIHRLAIVAPCGVVGDFAATISCINVKFFSGNPDGEYSRERMLVLILSPGFTFCKIR